MVVRTGDQVAAYLQLARVAVGSGHNLAVIDHAVFQRGGDAALGDAVGPPGIARSALRRAGDAADGGGFYHAPHVNNVDTVAFLPHLDKSWGNRGAAGIDLREGHALRRVVHVVHKELDPDGGNAVGHARRSSGNGLGKGGGGYVGVGKHERGARHEAGKGNAPAQHVTDGDAAQESLAVGDAQRVRGAQLHGLQIQRTVRIQYALGGTRGACGIAQCRGRALI